MTVLDTSFIVDVLRGKRNAPQLATDLEQQERLFIPTPVLMELWEGTLQSAMKKENQQKVNKLITQYRTLDFDSRAAIIAAEVKNQLRNEPIETEDIMIAAIALAQGMQVVTNDAHYTRIPGLRVLKY